MKDSLLDADPGMRRYLSLFLLKWMEKTPAMENINNMNWSGEFALDLMTTENCMECYFAFISGWVLYNLNTENPDFYKGAIAGMQSAIEFYEKNKKFTGELKEYERFILLKKENKLEKYLKESIKSK